MTNKITKNITDKYDLISEQNVNSIHSYGYLLKHKKTGANVVVLSNTDENKVFSIGFKTPPKDSTGVAHIIEHSVLCGSKNFPLKDPFIELVKGSLNTFINAMTFPDKTIYPVASCNDVDFQNLMHVYLDAVFQPKIYTEEKIFMQEGWHYDLESLDADLSVNGVVYNEMKGAFSSPDEVMSRGVFSSLYPETAYGMESGGEPEEIPELTYQNFLEFHKKFYHPSNSYIYLYGNMDFEEKLIWMDETYLSNFSKIQIDSEIALQEKFEKPKYDSLVYAISEEESNEEATYLTYNKVIGDNLDPLKYIAYQVIDYVLCSSPGSPVQKALQEANIGKEIYAIYENGIKQPYFSVVAKGANIEDEKRFVEIIEDTFQKQSVEGINKAALEAALNYYEFKQREADFGGYPKGLLYGLQSLDSWLYDEKQPFLHVDALEYFEKLHSLINEGYFEKLVSEGILNNSHASIVSVVPDKKIAEIKEQNFIKKMAAYKATLSKEELEKIITKKKELTIFQDAEDSKEVKETIPLLNRRDIKKEAMPFKNEINKTSGITHLHHKINTNGIMYTKLLFEAKDIPNKLLPYLRLLKDLYTNVNTKNFSYNELSHAINKDTGGISFSISTHKDSKNLPNYKMYFSARVKALEKKVPIGFSLVEEILFASNFEDTKRIKEVISEQKSREQARMVSSGDQVAALSASAYFSETAKISEIIHGISYYRFLEELETNFEKEKMNIVENIKETMTYVFREGNLLVDTTSTKKEESLIDQFVKSLKSNLFNKKVISSKLIFDFKNENIGYQTSAQVQYVCRAGDYRREGLSYTGALEVLKVIMSYEYLWMKIRVKGGAYGCSIRFSKSGESVMTSYRDPNLLKTIEAYEDAPAYIRSFNEDERSVTKYLIGAISNIDTPLNPSAEGARSLSAYLSNVTIDDIQKERNQVLNITKEEIKNLAPYVEALLSQKALCVVGNTNKITENKNIFGKIEPLFQQNR